jgi:tetratricopeptide (TPR) repeat protein
MIAKVENSLSMRHGNARSLDVPLLSQKLPVLVPRQITDTYDLVLIDARSNMGIAQFLEGHLHEAEHIHRHVYSKRRKALGRSHPETIKSKANIAMTLNELGKHKRAEALYRDALLMFQRALGHTHPDTLKTFTNLATNLHDQGKFKEAEEAITAVVPIMQSTHGQTNVEFIDVLELRAVLLHCLELYTIALDVAGQVYEQRLISLGYEHHDTQRALSHVRDLAENCEEEQIVEAFDSCVPFVST